MFLYVYGDGKRYAVCMAKNKLRAINLISNDLNIDVSKQISKNNNYMCGILFPNTECPEHILTSGSHKNKINLGKLKRKLRYKLYYFWNHTILLLIIKIFRFNPQFEDFG